MPVQLQHRIAKMTETFAYDYACRLFGKEAVDSLPRFQAGKNKDAIKGYLIWRTAKTAGYVRECQGPCKAGGLVDAWIGEGAGSHRNNAMRGEWCGRIQDLAGSRSVLTQSYRDQCAAEQARHDAEMAEIRARIAKRGDPCGVLGS